MELIRTFIALELPGQLKQKLSEVQQMFMQRVSGVRWVRPEQIHLTLKFLGATARDKVPAVGSVLETVAGDGGPFLFSVAGLGAFPNSRNPKVVWAGITTDDCLARFQQQLEEGLSSLGFGREDRPFAPHLTLGRVRDGRSRRELRELLEQHSQNELGSFSASRLIFFRSDLQPSGPVYTILKEIELAR
jgi:2'-5' RNA ligase